MKRPVRYIVQGGIIAAVYFVVTLIQSFLPGNLAFGPIQIRIAEAMMILPLFTPAAVPGLALGCFLSNLLSPLGWVDWVFGTLATLIAAILVRLLRRGKWISPVYPVVVNAFVVGFELNIVLGLPFWLNVSYVAIGEVLACFGLGLPLMILLEKMKARLFPEEPKRPASRADADRQ